MTGGSVTVGVGVRGSGVLLPTGGAAASKVAVTAGDSQRLTYGTGSGQADLFVHQTRTINAATAAVYDLYSGNDLFDVFGDVAPFRKVKSIAVGVESGGDTAGITVGSDVTKPWVGFFADASDKAKVFPGGPPYLAGSPAGVAVGLTTSELRIANLGAVAVTVRIFIAGTTV